MKRRVCGISKKSLAHDAYFASWQRGDINVRGAKRAGAGLPFTMTRITPRGGCHDNVSETGSSCRGVQDDWAVRATNDLCHSKTECEGNAVEMLTTHRMALRGVERRGGFAGFISRFDILRAPQREGLTGWRERT